MANWYITIWPEAADLRNAGQDGPRLSVLDQAMQRFGAILTPDDRTGTGKDNHFMISFPNTVDEMEFFDVMMSTPEVMQSNTIRIPVVSAPDLNENEEYQEVLKTKFQLWQKGDKMQEVFHARSVRFLTKCLPPPKGPTPR